MKLTSYVYPINSQSIENIFTNFYNLELKNQGDSWNQTMDFLKFAAKSNIHLSPNELENGKNNFYHIMFNYVFRTLQKCLEVPSLLQEISKVIDIKTNTFLLPAKSQTKFVLSLLRQYSLLTKSEPLLITLFQKLESQSLSSIDKREFAFYQDRMNTLESFLPAILLNVIRMWLSNLQWKQTRKSKCNLLS